jgi:hypothetical protein
VISRLSGVVVAGLLSLAIGLERFANAMLLDGVKSYASTRFIVAAICTGAGGVLLAVGAITRRRPRRPRRASG